jgi:hypothetical protein
MRPSLHHVSDMKVKILFFFLVVDLDSSDYLFELPNPLPNPSNCASHSSRALRTMHTFRIQGSLVVPSLEHFTRWDRSLFETWYATTRETSVNDNLNRPD